MNHFLALRLADRPRDLLATLSLRFQDWRLPATWVHPQDLHLTLCYLGHCNSDELRTLPYAIGDLARTLVQPRLRLAGLGAAGGKTEPREVFAAVEDPAGLCATTHAGLAETLGLAAERHYHPHITLCRPRSVTPFDAARSRRDWPQLLEANGLADWGDCPTTDLVLYRSSERTPRYEALEEWPLIAA